MDQDGTNRKAELLAADEACLTYYSDLLQADKGGTNPHIDL